MSLFLVFFKRNFFDKCYVNYKQPLQEILEDIAEMPGVSLVIFFAWTSFIEGEVRALNKVCLSLPLCQPNTCRWTGRSI